jgi:hypothetical protein
MSSSNQPNGAATPSGIVVEPNMVEQVIPGYYHHFREELIPERTFSEQKGWIARRGSKSAWSMSRDSACAMVGFMDGVGRGEVEEGAAK